MQELKVIFEMVNIANWLPCDTKGASRIKMFLL